MKKKILLFIPAFALAAACGSVNEFAASTPDVRGQSIELAGTSAEGATFLQESSGVSSQDLSNPPEYLARTRAAIKGLNDLVKKFLTPVVDAVATGGKDLTASGDAKVFGPKDENGITWKLTVRRVSGHRFGWVLEGKPLGQFDSAYKTIAAGALQRTGDAEHRGAGRTSIDLDAYASIDPTSHAQGKLFNAFKHFGDDGEAKVVVYALKGFTADSTVAPAADAVVYGHKTPSGEAVVRVAAFSESLAPSTAGATDAGPELMLARLRWIPGIGGRADVYYPSTTGVLGVNSNGDVPSGKYIAAKSCWDKTEQEGFKAVAVCNAGQPVSAANCQIAIEGVESTACKPGIDREDRMSDSDENDVSAESDAPGKLDDAPASSMSETEND
ncbi:MAG: hypothetical protein E6J61_18505 [Deltaproteobacteria bacterium]|nr:MAG: hypothetical protein E6J61_18505 [Deltaproteobacteria bacterium]